MAGDPPVLVLQFVQAEHDAGRRVGGAVVAADAQDTTHARGLIPVDHMLVGDPHGVDGAFRRDLFGFDHAPVVEAGVLLLQLGDVLGIVVDEPRVVVKDEGDAVQVERVLLILLVSDAVLVDPQPCPVEPFAFEPVFGPFGVAGEEQSRAWNAESADEHGERGFGYDRRLVQQCAGKCQALYLRLRLSIVEPDD